MKDILTITLNPALDLSSQTVEVFDSIAFWVVGARKSEIVRDVAEQLRNLIWHYRTPLRP